jgi:putative transposase
LDNGTFHQSLTLIIPENVLLLFQPSYSPEVNPIERLWEYFKEQLQWETFANLQDLRNTLQKKLSSLSYQSIISLTEWEFIISALSVAEI